MRTSKQFIVGSLGMGLAITGLSFITAPAAQAVTGVFISELHYDNAGEDVGEFVEITAPAGTDLSTYSLELYNGNGGGPYDMLPLSGTVTDQQGGWGTKVIDSFSNAIENGSPDGLALVNNGTVVEFLSYEGPMTASDGAAEGMASTDIGVAEPNTTPAGQSLQRLENGTWTGPLAETRGAPNGQTVADAPLEATDPADVTGYVGSPVSLQLQASGGTPPYAWAVTGGILPDGLTLTCRRRAGRHPDRRGDCRDHDDRHRRRRRDRCGHLHRHRLRRAGRGPDRRRPGHRSRFAARRRHGPHRGRRDCHLPDRRHQRLLPPDAGGRHHSRRLGRHLRLRSDVRRDHARDRRLGRGPGQGLGVQRAHRDHRGHRDRRRRPGRRRRRTPSFRAPTAHFRAPTASPARPSTRPRRSSRARSSGPRATTPSPTSYDGSAYNPPNSGSSNFFGEIGLAANSTEPLITPTEVIDAQATGEIAARTAYNNAHRVVLDDGSTHDVLEHREQRGRQGHAAAVAHHRSQGARRRRGHLRPAGHARLPLRLEGAAGRAGHRCPDRSGDLRAGPSDGRSRRRRW